MPNQLSYLPSAFSLGQVRLERRPSHGWSARFATVLAIFVVSLAHWACALRQGEITKRYQRTVGIDTLHKEIELVDQPLAEQPAPRVRSLV